LASLQKPNFKASLFSLSCFSGFFWIFRGFFFEDLPEPVLRSKSGSGKSEKKNLDRYFGPAKIKEAQRKKWGRNFCHIKGRKLKINKKVHPRGWQSSDLSRQIRCAGT
jgi:hypothetical protein